MKTPFVFLVLLLLTLSSAFSTKNKKDYKFDGNWLETWGVGQKTDVEYHDRYSIQKNTKGGHDISCSTNEYKFIDVVFRKDSLIFKCINLSGNDTLPYFLQIDRKGKKIKGIAYSIRGERTNIEWKRVK